MIRHCIYNVSLGQVFTGYNGATGHPKWARLMDNYAPFPIVLAGDVEADDLLKDVQKKSIPHIIELREVRLEI